MCPIIHPPTRTPTDQNPTPIPPSKPNTQTTAPSSSSLHFECFDARGDAQVLKSRTALARILRGRVFVDECGVPDAQEFDAHDEASRHVIGLVGDAPVLYARWRLEEGNGDGDGGALAVIDRLAILPSHRGRGYASRALEFLLEDVAETARGLQRWVSGVVATVPVPMQTMGQKLQAQHGFEVLGAPYPDRNTTFVRMLRRAAPTAAAPPGT